METKLCQRCEQWKQCPFIVWMQRADRIKPVVFEPIAHPEKQAIWAIFKNSCGGSIQRVLLRRSFLGENLQNVLADANCI